MSKHPSKYIIGLTGNIATGKSVVRRMLEHLGAYTIDADALAHRAIAKGSPGYGPAVEKFGTWVLGPNGEIDRKRLGQIVFTDSTAMGALEEIIHPLVRRAADILIQRSTQPVVVVEAVKLLESSLRDASDSIWVTHAPERVQVERLMRKRGLSNEQALQRVRMQPGQAGKVAAADVAIRNSGSYDELWKQVLAAWNRIPGRHEVPAGRAETASDGLRVHRGRPRDSKEIAALLTRLSKGRKRFEADDVMADFGDKAYLLLQAADRTVGLAGWQVENLVARTTDLFLEEGTDTRKALGALLNEVERASKDLQCEASLVFPGQDLATDEAAWKALGYEQRTPEMLNAQAWQDAALESMPAHGTMFFKQLRRDRILRPI